MPEKIETGDLYNAGLLDLSRKAAVIGMAMDDPDLVSWALGLYRKYKADIVAGKESEDGLEFVPAETQYGGGEECQE